MKDKFEKYFQKNERNQPAKFTDVEMVEKDLKIKFPKEYVDFLMISNGIEGDIGVSSYLALWSVQDIPSLNEAYEVNEFAPGLLLFGSDGGDNAYAFDCRNSSMEIVVVPFIGMDLDEINKLGHTFSEFLSKLASL